MQNGSEDVEENTELKESQFLFAEKLVLHELEKTQVSQVFRASLTMHTFALKSG